MKTFYEILKKDITEYPMKTILYNLEDDQIEECAAEYADQFKPKWISVDTPPLCYKTGGFDGKQSDVILVKKSDGRIMTATCYSGFLDGPFVDFYDTVNELDIEGVVEYMVLPE